MPFYRDIEACGQADEITVIEDEGAVVLDRAGNHRPSLQFIDGATARAHPVIFELLLRRAEPLWTRNEILAALAIGAARPVRCRHGRGVTG